MIVVVQAFQFLPPSNGGHRAGFAFCKALAETQAMACITTNNNPTDYAPFQVLSLFEDTKNKYLSPQVANRIIHQAKALKATTLLLHQPFMAPILFKKARRAGLKIVLYAHNLEYQRFKSMGKIWWPIMYQLEKWSMHFADQVLFISEDDLQEAIEVFKLPSSKLTSAPYALSQKQSPNRETARKAIRDQLNISEKTKLLYFYGPMDYLPNREALLLLLQEIIPQLKQAGEDFMLMLSGKNLDSSLTQLIAQYPKEVKWLGFVDDFEQQLQAADLMLNPIWLGGGVKIKLMEALANGVTAVSFQSGALGIDPTTVPQKLHLIPDQDTASFVHKIQALTPAELQTPTPNAYYQKYAGSKIIERFLKGLNLD